MAAGGRLTTLPFVGIPIQFNSPFLFTLRSGKHFAQLSDKCVSVDALRKKRRRPARSVNGTSVKRNKGLTRFPAGAPKHGGMRGCGDGSGGVTAGGSQLDCVPRTWKQPTTNFFHRPNFYTPPPRFIHVLRSKALSLVRREKRREGRGGVVIFFGGKRDASDLFRKIKYRQTVCLHSLAGYRIREVCNE